MFSGTMGFVGTAAAKAEEGTGYGRSVCPDLPGYTRATMDGTMGSYTER